MRQGELDIHGHIKGCNGVWQKLTTDCGARAIKNAMSIINNCGHIAPSQRDYYMDTARYCPICDRLMIAGKSYSACEI